MNLFTFIAHCITMSLINKAKNKIVKTLREQTLSLLYNFFGFIPDSIKNQRGLKILIYHGINHGDPYAFNARFLSVKQFDEHLAALKKCYHVIGPGDLSPGRLSDKKLNVILTFDDGLKNNYTHALPALVNYNMPALFFISALKNRAHYLFNDILDVFSFIGPNEITINGIQFTRKKKWKNFRYIANDGTLISNQFHMLNALERSAVLDQVFNYVPQKQFTAFSEYLQLMSEEEIRQLSEIKGMVVGSHGIVHTDLSVLTEDELLNELKTSKNDLEAITGKSCDSIAFPYGNYNARVLKACVDCGYHNVFGTEKLNTQQDRPLVIERFTVNPYISAINQMYYIAKGRYE